MSSYHLSPGLIPNYLDAFETFNVRYLWGYTSSLSIIAREAIRLGRGLKLKVAITNAEPLSKHQREAIEEAFRCPARETYGMSETVTAASECEFGNMHLWPEVGWMEVLENDQPLTDGTSGEFICTGLLNADMPLIRYRLGDRGGIASSEAVCGCGRSLRMLSSLEGRLDDLLYLSDGRIIGRLDPVFKAKLPIRGAQIIQETLSRIRIRYVPTREFTPEAGRSIIDRLQDRLGRVDVVLESVKELPRGAGGKIRAVVCRLSEDEKKSVGRRIA